MSSEVQALIKALALSRVFTASSPVYSLWCGSAWLCKLSLQPSHLLHRG